MRNVADVRVAVAALLPAAALLLTGCGSQQDGGGVVIERNAAAAPYDGQLDDAADALECDGPPADRGRGDYDSGLESAQDSPADALGNWLDEEFVALPRSDYVVERQDDHRALLSFDVEDRTKVAVVVSDDVRDYDGDEGWGVTSWARCDQAEFPASYDKAFGVQVWQDADGNRVSTSRVQSFAGPEHCDWQDITFLYVGPEKDHDEYLRDTTGELADALSTSYADDVAVPRDAADTGYRHDGRELWLEPGRPDAAYLVNVDNPKDVERWPAAKDIIGCD
jgi:hypothetical protein